MITHSNNLLEFQDICPITGKWKLLIFVTNFASFKIFFFKLCLILYMVKNPKYKSDTKLEFTNKDDDVWRCWVG